MADKLMYIPINDTQNYPLCRLHLVVKNKVLNFLKKQSKVPKVVKPTNKKTLL